ncbi:MAG: hypothetical protein F6K09_18975 [Merismopedia sp. SIO2A8]|nr:hypothetical protein [Merismopedia sp. SIO2A8]
MSRSALALSLVALLILGGCKDNSTTGSVSSVNTSEEVNGTSSSTREVPSSVSSEATASSDAASSSSDTPAAHSPESSSANTATNASTNTPPNTPTSTPAEPSKTTPSASGGSENGVGGTVDSAATSSEGFQVSSTSEVSDKPGPVAPEDTTVIPGERFGMVTAATTYEQLVAEFGSDRLSNTEIHLGEGFMAPATRVDLGNDYSFSVVWTDGDRSAPLEIQDLGSGWTVDGIYNGMPFDELQTTLGDFELLGFGWDYGGTVMLEETPLEAHNGKLFIRLQPSPTVIDSASEEFLAVTGDKAVNSSDPNLEGMDIKIEQVVVRITPAY